MSREVSEALIPTRDLNHWRSSSTREMRAMGVLQANDASRVRSSKDCSGSVSRMAYFSRATTRASSLAGLTVTMSHLLGKHGPGCILAGAKSYSKSGKMARWDTSLPRQGKAPPEWHIPKRMPAGSPVLYCDIAGLHARFQ